MNSGEVWPETWYVVKILSVFQKSSLTLLFLKHKTISTNTDEMDDIWSSRCPPCIVCNSSERSHRWVHIAQVDFRENQVSKHWKPVFNRGGALSFKTAGLFQEYTSVELTFQNLFLKCFCSRQRCWLVVILHCLTFSRKWGFGFFPPLK